MGRVTLREISGEAGVSPTTVSFVLNDNPRADAISEATKKRVLDAAERLGYERKPDTAAPRTPERADPHTIGFISDDIANGEYAVGSIQGAQDAAWAQGKLLLVVNTDGDPEVEDKAARMLVERGVSGVIYGSYTSRPVEPPQTLAHLPTVLLNCYTESGEYQSFMPDEYGAARRLTEELIALGHTDIAFVSGPVDFWGARERRRGFEEAIKLADINLDPAMMLQGDWRASSSYDRLSEMLKTGKRPSAIVAANDRMALGCYDALRDAGLVPGQDVSVWGFDNSEIPDNLRPPLHSVQLPDYEMGFQAAMAIIHPERRHTSTSPTYISPELTRRRSVTKPAQP
jgi:LacI family transcriptional regulator